MFKKNKKPKEEVQKPETRNEQQTFDESAFGKLHVDLGLRQAFMGSEPMSRERYESLYFRANGPGAYFRAPFYEEYLCLYEKYIHNRGGYSDPDFYMTHMR
jgi:hypothetical protein